MKNANTKKKVEKSRLLVIHRISATGEIPVFSKAALARARKAKPSAKLRKASEVLHQVAIVA